MAAIKAKGPQVPQVPDCFVDSFDENLRKRSESEFITTMRRQSADAFRKTGIPGSRNESWRFSDIGWIAGESWQRASEMPVDAASIPKIAESSHRLVFVNGRFAPSLSHLDELPKGVITASISQAETTHPELLQNQLGSLVQAGQSPFADLNSAWFDDGAFIYVPQGAALEEPLHLVFVSKGDERINYPRTLVVMEANSEASIAVDVLGNDRSLSCPVMELSLADNSRLTINELRRCECSASQIATISARVGASATLNMNIASIGGRTVRSEIGVDLQGSGADCNLGGLSLVDDGELSDFHLNVIHSTANCTSNQRFKGVLQGKSRTVFDGMINVRQDAQQTSANQHNANLLLSSKALANSNPRLEILADDVKCSHGSTVGNLNDNSMFYLRSRGIGAEQARMMLVHAFANDVLNSIKPESMRERAESLLTHWLKF